MKFCQGMLRRAKSPLTPGRYDLLLYLRRRGKKDVTQQEMRAAFGVSRATMSEAIVALRDRGLVRRKPASDERTFIVKLTKLGMELFDEARSLTTVLTQQILKKLFPTHVALRGAVADYKRMRLALGDTAVLELEPLPNPDD